jgi:putative ABC transport system permease protein
MIPAHSSSKNERVTPTGRGVAAIFTSSAVPAMAWRNLTQGGLRTLFNITGVTLGTAVITASSVAQSGLSQNIQVENSNQDGAAWVIDNFETGMQIVAVTILIAAGFLIFNAFLMAVTQRQQQIGLLRSLGMTRGQISRMVLLEGAAVGLFGSLLGILAGPLLGNAILAGLEQLGMKAGAGTASWNSYFLALAVGIGIALLASWLPARQAARASPLVALRGQTQSSTSAAGSAGSYRKPALAGFALLAALLLLMVLAPPARWAEPQLNLQLALILPLFWVAGWLMILPASVGWLSRWSRRPLSFWWGNNGRLIADNLGRDRRRVVMTLLTFVIGVGLITSLTAILIFNNKILFQHMAKATLAQEGWSVFPFDQTQGALAIDQLNLETLGLEPPIVDDFYRTVAGRAVIARQYLVVAPEVSALFPGFPSIISDLEGLLAPGGFTFSEGDWVTARPIFEGGCGLLLVPDVVGRTRLAIGDTVTLTAVKHPITCTVAGIGTGGIFPTTFISPAAISAFNAHKPTSLAITPLPGVDRAQLEADMQAVADKYGDAAWLISTRDSQEALNKSSEAGVTMMNGMLLLVSAAAVMGMINTTLMSVTERQHELGLLRAIGSTRRQIISLITGEAALIGFNGALIGLLIGLGNGLIFVLAYGGKSFGVTNLPLGEAAWQALQPALLTGSLGLLLAPLVSAAAAYWPARRKGSVKRQ